MSLFFNSKNNIGDTFVAYILKIKDFVDKNQAFTMKKHLSPASFLFSFSRIQYVLDFL